MFLGRSATNQQTILLLLLLLLLFFRLRPTSSSSSSPPLSFSAESKLRLALVLILLSSFAFSRCSVCLSPACCVHCRLCSTQPLLSPTPQKQCGCRSSSKLTRTVTRKPTSSPLSTLTANISPCKSLQGKISPSCRNDRDIAAVDDPVPLPLPLHPQPTLRWQEECSPATRQACSRHVTRTAMCRTTWPSTMLCGV